MDERTNIPMGLAPTLGGEQADLPAPDPAPAWGSFTLLARVGHGGFGEVYRAWDPHLQREVALKLLLPGVVGGDAEYEAMLREARALASVRHPNIVPVHGIDRHYGRVGFWTDFVRGKTLAALVSEQGTFGAREAALIGLDVARALSAVHRAGLLHRDIKAENVMREEGGRILLMDFGLSALEQRQNNIAGTPNYMAPELFAGGRASAAADIYALGVLLYFLVAGEYPLRLRGLNTRDALEAFPKRKPLMDVRPDLPEPLLRTVATAMDEDPAKRFQSAGQLANALAESLGTNGPVEMTAAATPARASRTSAKWLIALLLTLVPLAGGGLAWYGKRARTSHPGVLGPSAMGATNDDLQKGQELLLRSYKQSDLARAVKAFQSALATDPGNALAEARLGAAYLAQHGYTHDPKLLDMATDASNQAVKLDSELAAPYITLARIAALQGKTQLATQQIKTAAEKEPRSAEVHEARGELYEAQGRTADALDEYRQASVLDPDDWRWPMSLGVAEFRQGNIDEAIRQWQLGAQKAPENAMAYYDLSIAHRQLGRIEEARQEMGKAIDLDPTAQKYAALGSLLLLQGKYDEAAEMEKKAIDLNPKSYDAYGDLGTAYLWSEKHHDDAIRAYRKAIELEQAERAERPHDSGLLAILADNYADVGDAGKSGTYARQALGLDADDPFVNYKTGEAFETLGRRDDAIPLIAKAVVNGYNAFEFEHNPQLAGLRGDPKFASALRKLQSKKK